MGQAPQVLVVGPVAWHAVKGSQPPLLTSQGLGPPDEELDAPVDVAPLEGPLELGLETEELPGAALEAPVNDEEGAGALLESSALELSPPEDADAEAEAPMVAADEGNEADEAEAAALEEGALEVATEDVPELSVAWLVPEREVPPLLVAAEDAREVPALEPEPAWELLATTPELLEDASSPELLPAHPTPATTHNNGTAARNKTWFMVERSRQAQRV